MRKALLIDFLTTCRYDQNFFVYETNDYDENLLLGRGTVEELKGDDEFCLEWLTCEVEHWNIREDGTVFIFIRGDHPEKPISDFFDKKYVEKWNRYDPNTRPWLHGAEVDYFGHEILGSSDYLYKYGYPYKAKEEKDGHTD